MMWVAFITGFVTQASLVVAIGPQNLFVLRQGLLGQYVGVIVWFCIFSDIILAFLAIYVLSNIAESSPIFMQVFELAAIAFLLGFSGLSFYRATRVEP